MRLEAGISIARTYFGHLNMWLAWLLWFFFLASWQLFPTPPLTLSAKSLILCVLWMISILIPLSTNFQNEVTFARQLRLPRGAEHHVIVAGVLLLVFFGIVPSILAVIFGLPLWRLLSLSLGMVGISFQLTSRHPLRGGLALVVLGMAYSGAFPPASQLILGQIPANAALLIGLGLLLLADVFRQVLQDKAPPKRTLGRLRAGRRDKSIGLKPGPSILSRVGLRMFALSPHPLYHRGLRSIPWAILYCSAMFYFAKLDQRQMSYLPLVLLGPVLLPVMLTSLSWSPLRAAWALEALRPASRRRLSLELGLGMLGEILLHWLVFTGTVLGWIRVFGLWAGDRGELFAFVIGSLILQIFCCAGLLASFTLRPPEALRLTWYALFPYLVYLWVSNGIGWVASLVSWQNPAFPILFWVMTILTVCGAVHRLEQAELALLN